MSLTEQNLSHIIQLFSKLQNLSISKEEYDELKQWALLSEENKQIWDSFQDEASIADHLKQLDLFDSHLALSKLKGAARRKFSYTYIAAAALILIVFSFSLYFITANNTPLPNATIVANDILPGGNKAVLTFSDQQVIVLDSTQNSIQIGENGISYANGSLVRQSTVNSSPRRVTLDVPRGGTYEITLEDGTKVWLNAATQLRFPETFIGAKTREVELLGEAYFEVSHNAKQPFIVKTSEEAIEVLGTSFNVSNYQSDDVSKTTLFTGKIALTLADSPIKNKILLLPGQQGVYDKQQKKLDLINVDGKKDLAWKNGDFLYENEHLLTIMKQLERWYDIKVIYQGDFKKSYFSGIVSRSQPLSAVLGMLDATEKIKFKIDKGRREVVLTTN